LNSPGKSRITSGQKAATAMKANVVVRPIQTMRCADQPRSSALTKSYMTSVEAAFSVESIVDMIAAIRPARTRPVRPTGRNATISSSIGQSCYFDAQ
jgi:hypothetical protein